MVKIKALVLAMARVIAPSRVIAPAEIEVRGLITATVIVQAIIRTSRGSFVLVRVCVLCMLVLRVVCVYVNTHIDCEGLRPTGLISWEPKLRLHAQASRSEG